jgi:predicted Zn-dependent protease
MAVGRQATPPIATDQYELLLDARVGGGLLDETLNWFLIGFFNYGRPLTKSL